MLAPDSLHQITADRQQDLLASAAVHRLVPSTPTRSRIARSLRRAADRIDATAVSPAAVKVGPVRSALPGGGC
jgi:hypothetical protein